MLSRDREGDKECETLRGAHPQVAETAGNTGTCIYVQSSFQQSSQSSKCRALSPPVDQESDAEPTPDILPPLPEPLRSLPKASNRPNDGSVFLSGKREFSGRSQCSPASLFLALQWPLFPCEYAHLTSSERRHKDQRVKKGLSRILSCSSYRSC